MLRMLTAAACLLVVGSCARQGYPPGGPPDETSPRLLSMSPEAGATGVSRDMPLIFEFSEPMDQESVEANFFIAPLPDVWPRFQWRDGGRVFVAYPGERYLDGTTYVATIGSKAADRRQNSLAGSVVLTFSTGDTVEDRRIAGRLVPASFDGEDQEPVAEVDVAAYRLGESSTAPDPRNDVPDYVVQSGQDGTYEFAGLSQGTYRLFAIGDRDGDGFFTEGYDRIGIPSRDIVITAADSVVTAPVIAVTFIPAGDVQFSSVRTPHRERIDLVFDRPVDPGSLVLSIDGLDTGTPFADSMTPRIIVVPTAPQENRRYVISRIDAVDASGNHVMRFEEPPEFQGNDRPDTAALGIVTIEPALVTPPREPVVLTFNRMLDLAGIREGVLAGGTSGDLDVEVSAPDQVRLTPKERWQDGSEYRILFDRERLRSSAGNPLAEADSLVAFRVAPMDTLGTIEGDIVDSRADGSPYVIRMLHIGTGRVAVRDVSGPGAWSSEPVLPGGYLVQAFRDEEGDGVPFYGRVVPFSPSNPVAEWPDTVTVESRWPSAGISLEF